MLRTSVILSLVGFAIATYCFNDSCHAQVIQKNQNLSEKQVHDTIEGMIRGSYENRINFTSKLKGRVPKQVLAALCEKALDKNTRSAALDALEIVAPYLYNPIRILTADKVNLQILSAHSILKECGDLCATLEKLEKLHPDLVAPAITAIIAAAEKSQQQLQEVAEAGGDNGFLVMQYLRAYKGFVCLIGKVGAGDHRSLPFLAKHAKIGMKNGKPESPEGDDLFFGNSPLVQVFSPDYRGAIHAIGCLAERDPSIRKEAVKTLMSLLECQAPIRQEAAAFALPFCDTAAEVAIPSLMKLRHEVKIAKPAIEEIQGRIEANREVNGGEKAEDVLRMLAGKTDSPAWRHAIDLIRCKHPSLLEPVTLIFMNGFENVSIPTMELVERARESGDWKYYTERHRLAAHAEADKRHLVALLQIALTKLNMNSEHADLISKVIREEIERLNQTDTSKSDLEDDVDNKISKLLEKLNAKVERDYKKAGKPIVAIDFETTHVIDTDLAELAPLKSLDSLKLSETKVTDNGLKEIASLKSLTKLYLSYTKVTDAGLKNLTPLRNLTTLTLNNTRVTDAGIKELAPLINLNTLGLRSTKVTDAGIKDLTQFKNLSALGLNYTGLTNDGLKQIAQIKTLTLLDLRGTNVTDQGMKELKPLTNLTTIQLAETKVTYSGKKLLRYDLPKCNIFPFERGLEIIGSDEWLDRQLGWNEPYFNPNLTALREYVSSTMDDLSATVPLSEMQAKKIRRIQSALENQLITKEGKLKSWFIDGNAKTWYASNDTMVREDVSNIAQGSEAERLNSMAKTAARIANLVHSAFKQNPSHFKGGKDTITFERDKLIEESIRIREKNLHFVPSYERKALPR